MSLRFTNTYSRELEEFSPLDPEKRLVKLYTCGPTVYDFAHIGNLRAFIFEDLLQRHLESKGYHVHRVMNLTDVDDKTIRGCNKAKVSLDAFTKPFKDAFFEDLKTLRIKNADQFPSATDAENIARMIEMIRVLIEKGYAYQAEDKSVYYRIHKFPNYGKLAHLDLEQLRPSGRISHDDYEKESIGDFALWKAWDAADQDVGWDSPWGRGRPGWHIECSAMARGILGDEIDIHCGGVDNIFPHHEAEIAQSEAVTGKRFVKYWLHCAHLMIEGQKMSKSLGNFYTLRDLLAKGYTGREIRYALLRVNYSLPLNFTIEGMKDVRESLKRIDEWVRRLEEVSHKNTTNPNSGHFDFNFKEKADAFEAALDHDLNISGALGYLFEVIRQSNRALDQGNLSAEQAKELLQWWKKIDAVLAVSNDEIAVSDEVKKLLEARHQAREQKDWSQSDLIRSKIAALGWTVKDTKEGQKLMRNGG